MTGNGSSENPDDDESTAKLDGSRESNTSKQAITLADLLNVQQGEAIAVRATIESDEIILAGRVTSFAGDGDPKTAIEQHLEEYDSTDVLSIDGDAWWVLSDGATTDRSQRLHDRPQAQEYLDIPPKDPPDCSLSYRRSGRIGLRIPMPVSNGSRVIYYALDDYGTVIELSHGPMIQPQRLLPTDYDPP